MPRFMVSLAALGFFSFAAPGSFAQDTFENLPEHAVLDFWESSEVFKQSLTQTENGTPYIFYDGPPFATGLVIFSIA